MKKKNINIATNMKFNLLQHYNRIIHDFHVLFYRRENTLIKPVTSDSRALLPYAFGMCV